MVSFRVNGKDNEGHRISRVGDILDYTEQTFNPEMVGQRRQALYFIETRQVQLVGKKSVCSGLSWKMPDLRDLIQ